MYFHELRDKNLQIYIVATGAGAGIQNELWKVPGASSFLSGAFFPYDKRLTEDFLGFTPDKFCSPEAALDLAMEAYRRAVDPAKPEGRPVGLALTASVASLTEHRGDHRAHVACITDNKVVAADILLPKGVGTSQRLWDGNECDDFGLRTLMLTLSTEDYPAPCRDASKEALEQFFKRPVFFGKHRVSAESHKGIPIFPGAFNPAHQGHFEIADRIESDHGSCVMSICSTSPHKPPLSLQQMLRHSTRLNAGSLKLHRFMYTRGDPLYIDKARNSPGSRLVMGADALERMLDPQWGTDIEKMFAEFEQLGTTFTVFGRPLAKDSYLDAAAVLEKVPVRYQDRFTALRSEHLISSTELRAKTG